MPTGCLTFRIMPVILSGRRNEVDLRWLARQRLLPNGAGEITRGIQQPVHRQSALRATSMLLPVANWATHEVGHARSSLTWRFYQSIPRTRIRHFIFRARLDSPLKTGACAKAICAEDGVGRTQWCLEASRPECSATPAQAM